jgi:ribosomal protein L37E
MAIQVGRWDCSFCGHKGNPGPEQHCSACGKPRGDNVKFYLPDDAETVTGMAEIARAKSGPDWVCDYCGASNIHTAQNCHACGNVKNQADQSLATRTYNLGEVPTNGNQAKPAPQSNVSPRRSPKKRKGLVIIGIVIALIFVFYQLGKPKVVDLTVIGHEWQRTIDVENYRPVEREDWFVPVNGTAINSYRAIHHYDRVLDHYETRTRTVRVQVGEEQYVSGKRDLGNGYFEDVYSTRPVYKEQVEEYQEPVYRDVPVYNIKYVYRIKAWVTDHTAVAEGKDKNPYWPEGAVAGQIWRDGAKNESYVLRVNGKENQKYKVSVDYEDWQRLDDGDRIQAKKMGDKVKLIDKQNKSGK